MAVQAIRALPQQQQLLLCAAMRLLGAPPPDSPGPSGSFGTPCRVAQVRACTALLCQPAAWRMLHNVMWDSQKARGVTGKPLCFDTLALMECLETSPLTMQQPCLQALTSVHTVRQPSLICHTCIQTCL